MYVSGVDVDWDTVRDLNALGVLVLSRSVVLDPPPGDQVPQDAYVDGDQT